MAERLVTSTNDGRRVIAILGAGGALGAAISATLAGEADTDLVLSDVSDALAAGDDRRHRHGAVETGASPTSPTSPRSKPSSTRTVERFGRLDVLISNAGVLAPNGRIHNLTDDDWQRVIDINLMGSVNAVRAAVPVDAPPAVGLDHPHRLGRRPHRLVARRSVLRHQGRGDPPRQGRRGGVRRATTSASTACARERSCRPIHADLPQRGDRRHGGEAPAGPRRRPPTSPAPTRTWRATPSRWTTGSAIVVDGGYSAP